MNRVQCTLEVYNFLRESPVAGHLFEWDKRDEPRGQRGPQVDFSEREQQLVQLRVCTGQKETSKRRRIPCRTQWGAKETHFQPRPPSRVSKVVTSQGGCPQSAKHQIICLNGRSNIMSSSSTHTL